MSGKGVNDFDDADVLAVLKTSKGRDLQGAFESVSAGEPWL